MNQLDMMTTMVDALRQLPETRHLKVALRTAEKRIDVLRARRDRRLSRKNALAAVGADGDVEMAMIAQANAERFRAAGRCDKCGYILPGCVCLDRKFEIGDFTGGKDLQDKVDK